MRFLISVILLMIFYSGFPARADELSDLRDEAKSGDAIAQYNLGVFYDNKEGKGRGKARDSQQAMSWYTKAAEQGHANAQFNLGRMYVTGKGVTQDAELGVSWQLKAAEQGLASAQFVIGKRYFSGAGLAQDYQLALEMFSGAANQGFVSAQNQLGAMLFKGEGVPQDLVQAHMWFNIASTSGDGSSAPYRSVLEEIMDQAQIEEAQRLAQEWVVEHESEPAN